MFDQIIDIKEVVQTGDVFLGNWHCQKCGEDNFACIKNKQCYSCKSVFYAIRIPDNRRYFRLVYGTVRKKSCISKRKIRTLREIQQNSCAYCDKEMVDYHVDHITPISVGGTNNIDNLCLSCPACNFLAGSMVFDSLYAKKNYILGEKSKRKNSSLN